MEIAIIAHDLKKELMAQFCIAYCGVLANHHICATASTAQYISEATGLQIDRLMSGTHGGEQQIASRVAFNEIDVLLYFRSPNPNPRTSLPKLNSTSMLLCMMYLVAWLTRHTAVSFSKTVKHSCSNKLIIASL